MRRILILVLTLVFASASLATGAVTHGTGGHGQDAAAHAQLHQHGQVDLDRQGSGHEDAGGAGCCGLFAVHCAGVFLRLEDGASPYMPVSAGTRFAISEDMLTGGKPEAETPPPRL